MQSCDGMRKDEPDEPDDELLVPAADVALEPPLSDEGGG
jgi:hypothetical protein